jgi:hypothetical protein
VRFNLSGSDPNARLLGHKRSLALLGISTRGSGAPRERLNFARIAQILRDGKENLLGMTNKLDYFPVFAHGDEFRAKM